MAVVDAGAPGGREVAAGGDGLGEADALTPVQRDPGHVAIAGARVHNLRNLTLNIPRDRMTSMRMSTIWMSGIRLSSTRLVSVLSRYLPPFTLAKDSSDGVAEPSRQTACASLAR